jgi:hypothetical protein
MKGRKLSPSLAVLLAVLLLKFNVAHGKMLTKHVQFLMTKRFMVMSIPLGGVCDNVAPIATSWPGGITYQALNIPITTTISQWTLVVTFSAPISSLSVTNQQSIRIYFALRKSYISVSLGVHLPQLATTPTSNSPT